MDFRAKRQNECCRKPENYSVEIGLTQQSFERCKVCKCRHFVVHLESMKLNSVPIPLIKKIKNET